MKDFHRAISRWTLAGLLAIGCAGLWAQTDRIETRSIELTQFGFEPRELKIRPGPIRLVFRSKLAGEAQFQFAEVGRKPEKAIKDRTKARGVEQLTLSPGTYELTDTRFPRWKCVVRVEP